MVEIYQPKSKMNEEDKEKFHDFIAKLLYKDYMRTINSQ